MRLITNNSPYRQEALDKAFFMLYICRCEYQWIKGLIKKNEKETSTI
ncbi:hypothetical protein BACOVA_04998 [Bacteroides ovatus ATCC 8483]|uniref:Uncharacterized protein n=1 Tax=Bacteroides ovatus (strain ATCC 8483 / DSM 1896 / JCM 5824 / BCRC 10623 / CCUG 4943 / NCTC 11153) TaxID=411476 RepID=A0AAN3D745_BACO1|nr:hypothetical protein BACOVA_04998 [Bacteroides ovatus ATCC 8483]DAN34191.1 MAG TPA: hypothetical protein [Caudoviricetes sp.]